MKQELRSQRKTAGNSTWTYKYYSYHSRIGIAIELYFITKLSDCDPKLQAYYCLRL